MKVIFDSKSENESLARYICAAFCATFDPTVEALADIKCTVSEAVTNCVVHAYRDTVGKIYMTLKAYDDATVTVSIRDRGCGIDDLSRAREPLFTTDAAGERSGMGFPIMESLSERFSVTSKPQRGTQVNMTFKLDKNSKR
ncbi:MAG: anti-sigma F factor [Clostridia bacterium]|nr:anti-sigma F factor [Clostridia bacterium]